MNRHAVSCAVLAAIAVLSGCAGSPDLTDGAAARLQADVRTVTQSSQDGDIPGARAALDTLTRHVTSARADGDISTGRSSQIKASIDLISADLATAEQQDRTLAATQRAAAARAAATKAAVQAAAAKAAADAAQNRDGGRSKHHKGPKNG